MREKGERGLVGILHIAPDTCEGLLRDFMKYGVREFQSEEKIKILAKHLEPRLRGKPYIVSNNDAHFVPYRDYVKAVALNLGKEGDAVIFDTSKDRSIGVWCLACNIRPVL